ncbi:PTS sugar transporter subunit IIA [Virgibacillus siamensis]|uniref:Ascorbate-specific PTS system EIIA component n=1 Tax=Virgibacillus siamensis TaxID=480071 RepID=A0ABN1FJK8_9BACI
MLNNVLTEDKILLQNNVKNWEEAIQIAAKPLVPEFIKQDYVQAMIENVKELGPYIVIAPDIAIAHARPDGNVHKVGLSLLKLDESINFGEDSHYAALVFVLAAVDNEQHLDLLSELANVLNDSEKVSQIKHCSSSKKIVNIISKTHKEEF